LTIGSGGTSPPGAPEAPLPPPVTLCHRGDGQTATAPRPSPRHHRACPGGANGHWLAHERNACLCLAHRSSSSRPLAPTTQGRGGPDSAPWGAGSDGLKALQHEAWAFRPRNSPTNPRPVRSAANAEWMLRWHFLFPAYGSSVNENGDENGGRLGFSLLVIRTRRRSRQPIPRLLTFRPTIAHWLRWDKPTGGPRSSSPATTGLAPVERWSVSYNLPPPSPATGDLASPGRW
jgi:hypothetical protein